MKIWASAALLVAASLILASPWIWRHAGGAQARAGSHEMLALAPRSAAPTRTPEPTPTAPAPLVHRPDVLQRFACAECHGVDSGWLMPADHASMSEGECRSCHQPAPEPPSITLHEGVGQDAGTQDCGLCHRSFATAPQPAPTSQQVCVRCHGAQTDSVLPESHAGRSDAVATCAVCHQEKVLDSPPVPHKIDGWEQCAFCHGPQRLTALAGAHDGADSSKCLTCHEVVNAPRMLSNSHASSAQNELCGSCHAAGAVAPVPPSHDGRAEALCALCHQPVEKDPPLAPASRPDTTLRLGTGRLTLRRAH